MFENLFRHEVVGLVRKTSNDTIFFYLFPRKKFSVSYIGFLWCPNYDIYLFFSCR